MSACICRHCKTPAAATDTGQSAAHPPVELPATPRSFRVHLPSGNTQDCTLHPEGRLTMDAVGYQWVSALTFDEMRDTNWAEAHIEWDPAELPEPEAPPAPVQELLVHTEPPARAA